MDFEYDDDGFVRTHDELKCPYCKKTIVLDVGIEDPYIGYDIIVKEEKEEG